MANSSEVGTSGMTASGMRASGAGASDWITQAGLAAQSDGRSGAPGAQPSWIAALGPSDAETPGGFREIFPFGRHAAAPEHSVAPEHPVTPGPNSQPGPAFEPEAEPMVADRVSPEEEAYMRGYAEGHAEAKRAGDAAIATERARYSDLRLAFRTLDAAALDALAQDLNITVLALCEQVLSDYATDKDALAARCRAAANRLGAGPRELTVQLHPATRECIDAQGFAGWTFEDDPTLAPGALNLTSADGTVRDGPEDWMRAFAEALGA